MDIIIYCFIVLLWKSTLIYKTPKETAMSAGLQNIGWYTMTNAVIKIVYSTLYSKRIYLTRSLSIAATKTVDCSFIKAKHSTQVSSKNINSIEKILVQTIRRTTTCFTKFPFAICCTSTICSAVYYLVKTLFLKAVKQLRCFFFCFRLFVFCFIG